MSYELRQDETLGDGLRRIVCKQIEDAICAGKAEQNGRGSPVHETRKHLKKARRCVSSPAKSSGRFGNARTGAWRKWVSSFPRSAMRRCVWRRCGNCANSREEKSAASKRRKNFSPSSSTVFWRRFPSGPRRRKKDYARRSIASASGR